MRKKIVKHSNQELAEVSQNRKGATTFTIATIGIMTLGIMKLTMITLGIIIL